MQVKSVKITELEYNEIKAVEVPKTGKIKVVDNEEKIVSMKGLHDQIVVSPLYYKKDIDSSFNDICLRETVANKLIEVATKLPREYQIKLVDGWHSYDLQCELWNLYYYEIKSRHSDLSLAELTKLTEMFITKPDLELRKAFLHSTGGTVDLTLMYNYQKLDMGTEINDITDFSHTAAFENIKETEETVKIKQNRRCLYDLMTSVGFTNLPSKWWHYDYGNRMWSAMNKELKQLEKAETAIYGGIYNIDITKIY